MKRSSNLRGERRRYLPRTHLRLAGASPYHPKKRPPSLVTLIFLGDAAQRRFYRITGGVLGTRPATPSPVSEAPHVILSGTSMRRPVSVKSFCVNLSPSFSRLGYPRSSPCPTALLSGGYTRGRQPSCGGSRQHRCMLACFLLAGSVLPAWGEPAPPRLALGGNGLPTICQVFFEGLVPFRVASKRGKP